MSGNTLPKAGWVRSRQRYIYLPRYLRYLGVPITDGGDASTEIGAKRIDKRADLPCLPLPTVSQRT